MTELSAPRLEADVHQNLRDLMKEQNNGREIAEVNPDEGEDERQRQRERHRQTMRSILRLGSLRNTATRRTLWEVIQSENQSKAWERLDTRETPPPSHYCGNALWKAVFRLKRRRKEQEGEESFHLLESWGADRSPSVVDSARLQPSESSVSALQDSVRVFVVASSNNQETLMENGRTRWKSLRDKLSLRSIACCGTSWRIQQETHASTTNVVLPTRDWNTENPGPASSQPMEHSRVEIQSSSDRELHENQTTNNNNSNSDENTPRGNNEERSRIAERRQLMEFFEGSLELSASIAESNSGSAGTSMNLAAALAAERQLRSASAREWEQSEARASEQEVPRSPYRVSLMSLLEEGDEDGEGRTVSAITSTTTAMEEEEGTWNGNGNGPELEVEEGKESVCCVCMVRRKGAAFIPCGHTFCRLCTRELWVGRGSCPLCNQFILEILDIF
eukprot:TRINITY_DN7110_c0_g2_i3.p1 TRINITY_DN7110_c0_g2~~TRINITY_DN7110_c0_g2_i3.p1  ORF type:complete len:448 (-),score=37.47 TRINITY_DN7110_c0_g2_i3:367-1710(-)